MDAIFWSVVGMLGFMASIALGVYTFVHLMIRFVNPNKIERHPNPEYEKFLEEEFGPRYIPGQEGR